MMAGHKATGEQLRPEDQTTPPGRGLQSSGGGGGGDGGEGQPQRRRRHEAQTTTPSNVGDTKRRRGDSGPKNGRHQLPLVLRAQVTSSAVRPYHRRCRRYTRANRRHAVTKTQAQRACAPGPCPTGRRPKMADTAWRRGQVPRAGRRPQLPTGWLERPRAQAPVDGAGWRRGCRVADLDGARVEAMRGRSGRVWRGAGRAMLQGKWGGGEGGVALEVQLRTAVG